LPVIGFGSFGFSRKGKREKKGRSRHFETIRKEVKKEKKKRGRKGDPGEAR